MQRSCSTKSTDHGIRRTFGRLDMIASTYTPPAVRIGAPEPSLRARALAQQGSQQFVSTA